MRREKKKELVLTLIKDDLVNSKLVSGLSKLGLNANNYHLHSSEKVFELMGFAKDNDRNARVYSGYVELIKKVDDIDISDNIAGLNSLVDEIYCYLELTRI